MSNPTPSVPPPEGTMLDEAAELVRQLCDDAEMRCSTKVEGKLFRVRQLLAALPSPTAVTPSEAMLEGTWPRGVHRAFVEGAKWWEFHADGGTMWASDVDLAEAEAVKRYGDPALPPSEPTRREDVEQLASEIHAVYEEEALRVGWETQPRSRVPWSQVPPANQTATRAVARYVLALLVPQAGEPVAVNAAREADSLAVLEYFDKHCTGRPDCPVPHEAFTRLFPAPPPAPVLAGTQRETP